MNSRTTVYTPVFNCGEFATIKNRTGLNNYCAHEATLRHLLCSLGWGFFLTGNPRVRPPMGERASSS